VGIVNAAGAPLDVDGFSAVDTQVAYRGTLHGVTMRNVLHYANLSNVRKSWPCYCGSGKPLGECCW
jgi:hypothetical protein